MCMYLENQLYYQLIVIQRQASPAHEHPEIKTSAWTQLSLEATLYILSGKSTNTHNVHAAAMSSENDCQASPA